MVIKCPYPDMVLPQTNLLDYMFPEGEQPQEEPLWFDAKDPKVNLSPAQAVGWIKRLGYGLEKNAGLPKGEVVLIYTPNQILVPIAYLGIVGAGYVFSGCNPAYTVSELVHQFTNTTAKVILVHPKYVKNALEAAKKVGIPASRIFQFSPQGENPTINGVRDWRALLGSESAASSWRWPALSAEASTKTLATINFSSGTTGLPKGVAVSHANLIANTEQTIYMRYAHKPYPFENRPQERWLGFLPLYHAYGQLYTIVMAVKLKVPVFVLTEFRYEEFLFSIGRHRITSLQIAPPILVMLSKRPETSRYDLRSVKDVLCGSAPLSRELQNECQRRFDIQINQGWGMTETTCGAIHVPGGVKDDSGSVGRLDPNCEAKLVDEEGNEVEIGKPGELLLRGPQVCLGYWRNPTATKELLGDDGWLRSGDIAVCNKEGYFWIVDRKKELIKVNALQVAPAELEGVLLENDDVADAAVVGITIQNEELPRAYVVIHETSKGKVTPESIAKWFQPRVAKHKKLAGGVVFIDEVPKLQSGKIQRKTMREWSKRDAIEIEKALAANKGKPRARL